MVAEVDQPINHFLAAVTTDCVTSFEPVNGMIDQGLEGCLDVVFHLALKSLDEVIPNNA